LIISDGNEDAEAEKMELKKFVSRNIEGVKIIFRIY